MANQAPAQEPSACFSAGKTSADDHWGCPHPQKSSTVSPPAPHHSHQQQHCAEYPKLSLYSKGGNVGQDEVTQLGKLVSFFSRISMLSNPFKRPGLCNAWELHNNNRVTSVQAVQLTGLFSSLPFSIHPQFHSHLKPRRVGQGKTGLKASKTAGIKGQSALFTCEDWDKKFSAILWMVEGRHEVKLLNRKGRREQIAGGGCDHPPSGRF